MHTVVILGAAAALLVAFLLLGHAWGGAAGHGLSWGARLFIPVWLLAAAINLWIGVSRAGYTVVEELPFFAIVFGVPAVIAGFIAWKWS